MPSEFPSGLPTVTPSVAPSHSPTVYPSLTPSSVPSSIPTDLPTSSPSIAPSNTPSVYPTTSANPTITCKDDENYRYPYPPWEDVEFCRWIRRDEDRRVTWCMEPGVHEGCPYTCGLYCRDDPSYTFVANNGIERGCKWLSQKSDRQDRYCDKYKNGSMVRYACPNTCNYCEEYVSFAPS